MNVRRTCIALLTLIGSSSGVSGQSGEFPSPARPRSVVPRAAVSAPHTPGAPFLPKPVQRTVLEVQKSHPEQIQIQLGLIAENLDAAGLIDEAKQLRALQRRVGDAHYERLLTAHKLALAKAVVPQISLRVRWIEVWHTPTTITALQAAFDTPEQAAARSSDDPPPETNGGVLPSAQANALIDELVQQGVTKIVTEPQITLLNGRTAQFRNGQEIELPAMMKSRGVVRASAKSGSPTETDADDGGISTRFVGTTILAAAVVEDDTLVNLSLTVEHTEHMPSMNSRRVQTEFELREGQTLVLAGHPTYRTMTQVQRIPMLGNIPFIGPSFFSSKTATREKHQLLVVITPEIVRPVGTLEGLPVPGVPVPRPQPERSKPSGE
jgi:Flp pilus assembly secretin CpaC